MDTKDSGLGRGMCNPETIAFSGTPETKELTDIFAVLGPTTTNANNNHLFSI